MAADIQTNNLITHKISTINQTKEVAKQASNNTTEIVNNSNNNTNDILTLTSKNNQKNKSSFMKFLNAFCSGIIIAGIFFLPDIVYAIKNKHTSMKLDKYKKLKPLIGDMLTSQKQEQISKNRIKTTLEAIEGRFKKNEIIIMDKKGLITQRILIAKEEMPNGKFIVRKVMSFKGHDLSDNLDITNHPEKYLFKKYYRSPIKNNESNVYITRKGQDKQRMKYYSTPNGEVTLIAKETDKHKINKLLLFDKDRCIGTDTQIIDKETKEQYNIVNIPNNNIFNKKYDFKKDGRQYSERLIQKFLKNF